MASTMGSSQNEAKPPTSESSIVSPRPRQIRPESQDNNVNGSEQGSHSSGAQSHNVESIIPNTALPQEPTFAQKLDQYRSQLDLDFHNFEAELEGQPRDQEMKQVEWDELQYEFEREVGEKIEEESEIMRGFESRLKQFMLWMQVSHERETERAIKRLKTQTIFVQNSETKLVEKEQHYEKVMSAFQTAMRLLTQTP